MAKAHRKLVGGWLRLKETDELIEGLATDMQISISVLVQTSKGGATRGGETVIQGTWIHPKLAIDLAMWCDRRKFAVKVMSWVDSILGKGYATRDGRDLDYIMQERVEEKFLRAEIEHLGREARPVERPCGTRLRSILTFQSRTSSTTAAANGSGLSA